MPYTPVLTDAARLARVPFSPGAVFEELKQKPSFLMPWLVLSVPFAVLTLLSGPFQARVMRQAAEQAGRPLPPFLDWLPYISAAMSPVTVLMMAALAALVLWVVMMATGEDVPYEKVLTVAIFSWSVGLIQQALTLAVLYMRGLEAIQGPLDVQVSLGLDLLLPAESGVSPLVRAMLAGIGPLQVWAMTIVAVGLMVLAGASKGRAWAAAAIQLLIGVLITAGFASLGARGMQG